MNKALFVGFAFLIATACERGARQEPAEVVEARNNAARNACAAAELVARAQDNYETLTALADAGGVGAARAVIEFAHVYAQHAQLRQAAIARVDSAVNHARTPADSARYMQAADRFVPGVPEPESIEANVFAAYSRDFQQIRANEDHRCNWAVRAGGS